MASIKIGAPNIDDLIQDYNQIQVHKSTGGINGPFEELTAASDETAAITGTVAGPFVINGLTLILKVDGGADQTVTFAGTNPVSATDTAAEINTAITGAIATPQVGDFIKIETVGTGTGHTLRIVGGTALAFLGFSAGTFAQGKAKRIPLKANVTLYFFQDVAGTDDDYYKTRFFNSGTLTVSDFSAVTQGTTQDTTPEQQADSRAPRGLTLIRGTTHTFRVSFFEDEAQCNPLIPKDASKWPSFQIVDIVGQIVSSGLAVMDGGAGHYRVDFTVPDDAQISNDDRRWRIEFSLCTADGVQAEKCIEFDVRDRDVTETEIKEQKFLALCGKEFRVPLRLSKKVVSLSIQVFKSSLDPNVAGNVAAEGTLAAGDIKLVEEGETFVYVFDIPSGVLEATGAIGSSSYTVIWEIQQSAALPTEHQFQIITVPPTVILPHMASLRMAIDKYQKRRQILQAYQDSDIVEYLEQGARIINGYHPLTNFGLSDMPNQLVHFWLLAASLWGLNAQHLLENDLHFDYSGQSVSLSYDHRSGLSEAFQRADDFLREGITAAKLPLFRRSASVGVMAGKPYRYNLLNNFTFKLSSVTTGDLLNTLTKIGLL